jgi:hypothetical protein
MSLFHIWDAVREALDAIRIANDAPVVQAVKFVKAIQSGAVSPAITPLKSQASPEKARPEHPKIVQPDTARE